jgi:uncharacterized membrane protein
MTGATTRRSLGGTAPAGFRLERASSNVGIVLALTFLARWLVSGRNSYWLDEIWSVVRFGIANPTGVAMVKRLASDSIHPPLYQLILFYWMRVFGDGEVATRFLSNLYVTVAALALYGLVRDAVGRRRALMATIFFSLMFEPFYYALETRSYGQSLCLSVLSSLALFRFMRVFARASRWKARLLSRACLLLTASNLGLMLTHYYDVFFLASQGVFLMGWVIWRARVTGDRNPRRVAASLVTAAVPLISPLVLLLLVWGPVMTHSSHKFGHRFVTTRDTVANPFSAFMEYALRPNFMLDGPLFPICAVLVVLCAALLAVFYAEQAAAAYRTRCVPVAGKCALGWYALVTAFAPFLFAYALFTLSGHERYSDRYFIFTAPSFAIMLVLALEQGVVLLDRLLRKKRSGKKRATRGYLAHSALCTLLLTALLVLPGTYEAATRNKTDWRGTAQLIANITREDPQHNYAVYATWGYLDYYLARAGARVRTRGDVGHGAKSGQFPSSKDRKALARYDFLVLAFPHLGASEYKKGIAKLDAAYELHQRLLDNDGLGIIIYRLKPRS